MCRNPALNLRVRHDVGHTQNLVPCAFCCKSGRCEFRPLSVFRLRVFSSLFFRLFYILSRQQPLIGPLLQYHSSLAYNRYPLPSSQNAPFCSFFNPNSSFRTTKMSLPLFFRMPLIWAPSFLLLAPTPSNCWGFCSLLHSTFTSGPLVNDRH